MKRLFLYSGYCINRCLTLQEAQSNEQSETLVFEKSYPFIHSPLIYLWLPSCFYPFLLLGHIANVLSVLQENVHFKDRLMR